MWQQPTTGSESTPAGGPNLRNADAFAEMTRRSYGAIYLTALSIVRDTETAQDVTQEAFLRAWLRIDQLRDAALIQPWLARIVRNLAMHWLRTGQSRSRMLPLISMEEVTVEPADKTSADPRQAAGQREQRGQVTDAVMALPDDLRQVVLLHYAEGMTASDIARLNGEAPSTVTRRLERARMQLRDHLEGGFAHGLAGMKAQPQDLQKALGLLGSAAVLPAASRAQLLQMAADTPPPPVVDPVTSAAAAAPSQEAGMMKSIFAAAGAAKLVAGAAVVAAVGVGTYAVSNLTGDSNNRKAVVESEQPQTRARVTAMAANQKKSLSRPETRNGAASAGQSTLHKNSIQTDKNISATTSAIKAVAGLANSTSNSETIAGYVTVRGKVSDVVTSEPLANAIVRAVAPAVDMRSQRKQDKAVKLPSAEADASGNYKLLVPLPVGATNIALDAFAPGYRSVSGTFMSGGDWDKVNIAVTPGTLLEENLDLSKALYVAGTIMDESGKPLGNINVDATLHSSTGGMAYVAEASTDLNGKFSIYDFPTTAPQWGGYDSGKLEFTSAEHMTVTIPNIYQVDAGEREQLRIVMMKGSDIRGQLLESSGNPASMTQLHIKYEGSNNNERRDVVTDDNGYFHLKGLPPGTGTLYARSMELDQRLKQEVVIPVAADMTLTMVPTPDADTSSAVTLLGMRLADVTPELKEKYDLYSASGVLVLDPGDSNLRFTSTAEGNLQLQVGDQIFVAGDKRIKNVKEFAGEILRINGVPEPGSDPNEGHAGEVRVVYSIHRSRANSSMTTHLKLSPEDVLELERFVAQE